jgi:hypothetical protein
MSCLTEEQIEQQMKGTVDQSLAWLTLQQLKQLNEKSPIIELKPIIEVNPIINIPEPKCIFCRFFAWLRGK